MHFNVLNRRVHYWVSFAAALPLLVIIASGVLLQMKKHWSWVQPVEHRGVGSIPAITLDRVLESVKGVAALEVSGWEDVNRIDVRPDRGIAKVWLDSGWEAQVDLTTAAVLHVAYRRSDFIESIHDGSFFGGDWTKIGVFLPVGIALLLMWTGGMWMWWFTFHAKRQRAALRRKLHAPH